HAFESLALTIGEERRVLEGRHHGAAQGREPIGRNARRRAERTAEAERDGGRGEQHLVGGAWQEIKREWHVLEVGMRLGAILKEETDLAVSVPARSRGLQARPERRCHGLDFAVLQRKEN